MGLYNHPDEGELARALAYYDHADDMRTEEKAKRERERKHRERVRKVG